MSIKTILILTVFVCFLCAHPPCDAEGKDKNVVKPTENQAASPGYGKRLIDGKTRLTPLPRKEAEARAKGKG